MDQNQNAGTKYGSMPPEEKLEQLRRYREVCKKGDADHQIIAEDYFVDSVVNDDLVDLYIQQEIARENSRKNLAN